MDPGQIFPLFLISVAAGILGAMLGLGGGIVIVPALTLLFGRDIHEAIGVSLVSVIATSTSAAAVYLREGYVNVRLGLLVGMATVIGGIAGGYLGLGLKSDLVEGLFGAMMLYTACAMMRNQKVENESSCADKLENESDVHAVRFIDRATGKGCVYRPKGIAAGAGTGLGAGLLSGVLGVGGGFINVPAMHLLMDVPLKAAIATSNYMIGITAAASVMIYFSRGYVKPLTVAPCAIGVLLGAQIGARIGSRIRSGVLRWAFVTLLIFVSAQMFNKALGGG